MLFRSAGVVGADGPTHNGSYDISFMRCLPNMTLMAPADENECRQMLYTACRLDSPAAVRYPRGSGPGVAVEKAMHELPVGKAQLRRQGTRIAILAFGSMVQPSLDAAEALDATVYNMRFVKPVDRAAIREAACSHELLVTIEEHQIQGGAGSAVAEVIAELGLARPILHLGFPDRFIDHGDPAQLLASVGLDAAGITRSIRARLEAAQKT